MGTIRAINQALGRVIRHAKDYGMIFFIDRRYCQGKINRELPGWVTESLQTVEVPNGELYYEIQNYFRAMAKKYPLSGNIYFESE